MLQLSVCSQWTAYHPLFQLLEIHLSWVAGSSFKISSAMSW